MSHCVRCVLFGTLKSHVGHTHTCTLHQEIRIRSFLGNPYRMPIGVHFYLMHYFSFVNNLWTICDNIKIRHCGTYD